MPLTPEDMEVESEATEVEEPDETEGTASLPIELFGENLPKKGDRITLEVRNVGEDGVSVGVASDSPEQKDEAKGIESLAAKFD